jgi:hypothetical protein
MFRISDEFEVVAKIVAGVTHQLNNVFSIVDEISGSIQDTINLGGNLTAENLKKKLDKISHHSQRGKVLVKSLNRFVHLRDTTFRETDIIELLEDFVLLHSHFINQKGFRFATCFEEEKKLVFCSPFYLFYACHQIVWNFLNIKNENSEIKISVSGGADSLKIVFSTILPKESKSDLNELIVSLGQIVSGYNIGVNLKDEEPYATVEVCFIHNK